MLEYVVCDCVSGNVGANNDDVNWICHGRNCARLSMVGFSTETIASRSLGFRMAVEGYSKGE